MQTVITHTKFYWDEFSKAFDQIRQAHSVIPNSCLTLIYRSKLRAGISTHDTSNGMISTSHATQQWMLYWSNFLWIHGQDAGLTNILAYDSIYYVSSYWNALPFCTCYTSTLTYHNNNKHKPCIQKVNDYLYMRHCITLDIIMVEDPLVLIYHSSCVRFSKRNIYY